MEKIGELLRKQDGKERTWVVCNVGVKRVCIGSLSDKRGWKWMTALKGLLGIIAKWTLSGKSGCIVDKADASRTPNGNKGDAAGIQTLCPF